MDRVNRKNRIVVAVIHHIQHYNPDTYWKMRNVAPTLDDNVVIVAGTKIIGDVRIGNNVIIGANAVVVNDMPDNCICGGIPARVIKMKEKID